MPHRIKEFHPIHEAVYHGDVDAVKELLAQEPTLIKKCTERNESPLHYAMCHGKKELIPILLDAKANPKKLTYSGISPLSMGIVSDHLDCVQTFLEYCKQHMSAEEVKQILNQKSETGEAPIHFATMQLNKEMVEYLISQGADVNLEIGKGETLTYMLGRMASVLAKQEEHMKSHAGHHHHHHHDHGDHCDHDHPEIDFDEKRRQLKEVRDFVIKSGAPDTPYQEIEYQNPPIQTPVSFLQFGFLADEQQVEQEEEFGGALWAKRLEVFYRGKKPQVGYCVEATLVFNKPVANTKVTWMRGIISEIQNNGKTLICTTELNPDHEGKFSELQGQWQMTLQFTPYSRRLWYVVKLVPLEDKSKTVEKLVEQAVENEKVVGRKIARREDKSNACYVLKGQDHHHHHHGEHEHEHKVVIGVDLINMGTTLVYYFEDGTKEMINDPKAPYLFNAIYQQNLQLQAQGKEGVFIHVDGASIEEEEEDAEEDVADELD